MQKKIKKRVINAVFSDGVADPCVQRRRKPASSRKETKRIKEGGGKKRKRWMF